MDTELERAVGLIKGWLMADPDSNARSIKEIKLLAAKENIRSEDLEEALVRLGVVAYGNALWGLPQEKPSEH
jgi:hypothetical protein